MDRVSAPLSRLVHSSGLGVATMLLSILLFSMMDAMVKWLGGNYPTQQIMFFRCLVAMIPVAAIIASRGGLKVLKTRQPGLHLLRSLLVSSIAIALFGWVMPSAGDWVFLIAVGLFGGIAQYLMTVSYRHSEIAVVAPLKFLSIVIGGLIAYFVWAEIPDLQSLAGISIIIAAGLYAMQRELLLARRAKR